MPQRECPNSLESLSYEAGLLLSFSFAVLPGRFEFFISGGEDGGVACGDAVGWGDVTESGVEAHGVVMVDEAADDAFGVLEGERGFGADGVFFEGAVEATGSAKAR